MAVGTTAALLLAGGAFSAATQVQGGQLQRQGLKRQATYDASVYDQQAEMVKEQRRLADTQFLRQAATARGTIVSRTAGKGLLLSGSPAAILVDTQSQLQFDQAVQDYNLTVGQNYATSAAGMTRSGGAAAARLAGYTGYTNAFSTLLNTGLTLGALNLKPGQGGRV